MLAQLWSSIIHAGKGRNPELDFLRGVAVLMVMLHHNKYSHHLFYLGTTGVQLFFVLSGFLVGGLLLKEVLNTGNIKAGKFILRRGFKIWPQFYVFLFIALGIDWLLSTFTAYTSGPWGSTNFNTNLLSELFFFQNFFGNIYNVTWSLAVEEHFYLVLPLWAFVGIKLGLFNKDKSFLFVATSIGLAMVFCTWSRVTDWHTSYTTGTWLHDRETFQHLDALFFGVFLSYMNINRTNRIKSVLLSTVGKWIFPLFAFGLILIGLLTFGLSKGQGINNGTIKSGLGYTILYIGYGCLLIAMLYYPKVKTLATTPVVSSLYKFIGWTGFHSYALYLWHYIIFMLVKKFMIHTPLHGNENWPSFIIGFVASYFIAVITTHTVEKYFLSIRNRILPTT